VLDLTCEFDENRPMRNGGRYLCLPVLDNTSPTPGQLREAVQWLSEALNAGRVYVHCAAGHGRSATVVIAYLLAVGSVSSVDEGIALLKSHRPGVRLNASQQAVLRGCVRRASLADI
jgi:protein-tyrosine phosphatase